MIYSSPRTAVAIPPVSLSDYVFEHASRWGDRPAIIDASTGHSLSFVEVRLGAQRAAAALAQRGWRKGDVLASSARTSQSLHWLFTAWAWQGA